ncbi:hypothetical protein HPB47_011944 [Ixodes persulcatus]|uniref:Uncharacterized protein n=1 Tax=Ixodes persulcatus TaxID=34615 RepID=A0AC60NV77_IXOPE|nr:hypothetical protein HPB47_011944 [Ixodes persulcatus]
MSLRTGEWDRGPRRLGFCQRVSPTVANYRKLRPMPGDDLLEPPCWSPLENPEPDSRRSDAPRGDGQPSELVLRSETIIEPVVLTDEYWKGTTYEGPRGLDPGDQHIWREQAAPPDQSTSRGRGPQAHARLRIAKGTDVTSRVWLSQLENVFYRNIRRLAWINGVSDAALRNNLRGHRLARFFPAWALNASKCTASTVTLGNNPVSVFHEVSRRTQLEKLRQVEQKARPREPGSTFDTRSSKERSRGIRHGDGRWRGECGRYVGLRTRQMVRTATLDDGRPNDAVWTTTAGTRSSCSSSGLLAGLADDRSLIPKPPRQ